MKPYLKLSLFVIAILIIHVLLVLIKNPLMQKPQPHQKLQAIILFKQSAVPTEKLHAGVGAASAILRPERNSPENANK